MRLYRFPYSCYARKAQMVLDLLGLEYELIDVPYGDRTDLATITGGYIQVPVLVDDAGTVVVDSRAISAHVLQGEAATRLVPGPWEGPIWAYADWCDGPLEDVLFRLASPGIRRWFERPADRAMYTFVKERKFGRGCVDDWERNAPELMAHASALLAPTVRTIRQRPYLFGEGPTLADAALYGQCAMLKGADTRLIPALAPELVDWMERVETASRR